MHFYIDHTKLQTQDNSQAFGPDSNNLETKYNLTSKMLITDSAKAFACQDGMLILQKSTVNDANGNPQLNAIIKPTDKLAGGGSRVAYYIYRGIKFDGLIDGANIVDYDSDLNNDLITRIYSIDNTKTYSSEILGYDESLSDSLQIDQLFYSTNGASSIVIKEGEWFGDFSIGMTGFEVITEPDKYNVTLGMVRAENTNVDVSDITDPTLEKNQREKILGFVDPAALFGLYFDEGISAKTDDGVTVFKNTELYSNIISLFETKNSVYIDIRSEKGDSYNFSDNYSDGSTDNFNYQIGFSSDIQQFVNGRYQTNEWPILIIDDPQTINPDDSTRNTSWLTLRVCDNVRPILFHQNVGVDSGEFDDIYPSDAFGIDTTNSIADDNGYIDSWTGAFSYSFPNTGSLAQSLGERVANNRQIKEADTIDNVSFYLKSFYYRRQTAIEPPATVYSQTMYYNSTFCAIDYPNLGDTSGAIQQVEHPNQLLFDQPLNLDGTGNFTQTAQQKAIWDSNRILFCTEVSKQFLNSGKVFLPLTTPRKLKVLRPATDNIFGYLNIICKQYQKTENTPAFNIIGVNGYDTNKNSTKERGIFLGITQAEFSQLKTFTTQGYKYIYLHRTAVAPTVDKNNNAFFEYTLLLQGRSSTNTQTFVTPTYQSQPITVYSRDNMFFSSPGFSSGETADTKPNRVEFLTTGAGNITINDNIDLCLPIFKSVWYYYQLNPSDSTDKTIYYVGDFPYYVVNNMSGGFPLTTKVSIPADGSPPTGYRLKQDFSDFQTQGVNAKKSFEKISDNEILTYGRQDKSHTDDNYQVKYYRIKGKNILVNFDQNKLIEGDYFAIIIPPRSRALQYSQSVRRFAKPEIVAAAIGIVGDLPFTVLSGGFSFGDGTCFPSVSHVNGSAMDVNYFYQNGEYDEFSSQQIITALKKFKFTQVFKGLSSQFSGLKNATKLAHHNDHIHGGKFQL